MVRIANSDMKFSAFAVGTLPSQACSAQNRGAVNTLSLGFSVVEKTDNVVTKLLADIEDNTARFTGPDDYYF